MSDSITIWKGNIPDYSLLDSGNGRKLERIGQTLVERAEPRAWWKPELPESEWQKADAVFNPRETGSWTFKKGTETEFIINPLGETSAIKVKLLLSGNSKHIGFFPEQSEQWSWIKKVVEKRVEEKGEARILNLFGYTGMATLAAAEAGAHVTHVDGSKQAIEWARTNQNLSNLSEKPVRWILDDVLRFIKKEAKQGKKYDGIIMDPPTFGRGPKGEVWKLEENIAELLATARELLSDKPLFIILNMYSTDLSSISLKNLLLDTAQGLGGIVEAGELVLQHENSERLLPLSLSARWSSSE